jgi:hypothetical protein
MKLRYMDSRRFVYLDGGMDNQADGMKLIMSKLAAYNLRDVLIEYLTLCQDKSTASIATNFLVEINQAMDESNCPEFYSKWDDPQRFFIKPSEVNREDD